MRAAPGCALLCSSGTASSTALSCACCCFRASPLCEGSCAADAGSRVLQKEARCTGPDRLRSATYTVRIPDPFLCTWLLRLQSGADRQSPLGERPAPALCHAAQCKVVVAVKRVLCVTSAKLTCPCNRRACGWIDPDPGVERDPRLTSAPTYVVSVVEERWLHAREVGTRWRLPLLQLPSRRRRQAASHNGDPRGGRVTMGAQVLAAVLHLRAERITPPKPTSKLAWEARKRHNYDKDMDVENVVTQRSLSLTVAWERLTRHIAHDPDMAEDDFALVFEGDVALHDNVSHADARQAVLHGMDLAREDGLLYLGGCFPRCAGGPDGEQWLSNTRFERCSNKCTHALAVTKRKAATLMADLRESMLADAGPDGSTLYLGYLIDQMLSTYSAHHNGTWTVGTNFAAPGNGWHIGIFYQDRKAFQTTIGNALATR